MGVTASNFYYRLFGTKEIKVALFGLDKAGKTTILYRLKLGEVVDTIPSTTFNVEVVTYKNINFTLWECAGYTFINSPIRSQVFDWVKYNVKLQAIVLVIDATDRERIEEARTELQRWINNDEMKNAVFLVIANKQDEPKAMTSEEVAHRLQLGELLNRRWHVQPTSAKDGHGLYESMDWLVNQLA